MSYLILYLYINNKTLFIYSGGLQPGDIVTHINGKEIGGAKDVYTILSDEKTSNLRMTVIRSGVVLQLSVTPEDI